MQSNTDALNKSVFLCFFLFAFASLTAQIYTEEQEYRTCDHAGTGIVQIPFSELQTFALDVLSEFDESPEIYVTNNTRGVSKISNLYDNPQYSLTCGNAGDGNGSYYDIAVDSKKDIYVTRRNGLLQKIDPESCAHQNITMIPPSPGGSASVLALSFDHQDNLYEGGWTSKVKRANAGDLQNWYIWHDFVQGNAAGDFVQIGDYLYIAWTQPNGKDYLFKVTMDADNQYVSHENLGQIESESFGLAAEYGRLYGVTRSLLYEIDISVNPVETTPIFHHPHPSDYADEWWGAAGLHEALHIEISYHRTASEAESGNNPLSDPYVNLIPYEDMVYIRIHESTEDTTYIIPIRIVVDPAPPAENAEMVECADEITGIAVFDLDDVKSSINPGQVEIQFYASQSDLASGINPLPEVYEINASAVIYAKVTDAAIGDCYGVSEVFLEVPSAESVDYESEVVFCLGTSGILSVPDQFVSYEWAGLQGEDLNQPLDGPQVVVTHPGDYTVLVIDDRGCRFTLPFHVSLGGAPQITAVEISDGSATVIVDPAGNYEYSLDGVFWQSSSVFHQLPPGDYTVYVRDLVGCYSDPFDFGISIIPNFISPNGDGYNDQWVIRGMEQYPEARIQIFDRYGKKIVDREINANDVIWDGKYKNSPVETGTYWYILQLTPEQKISGFLSVRNY